MGLLDELLSQAAGMAGGAGAAGGGLSAANHADLAHAVLDMLGSQQAGGGLGGLAQVFEQQGLGNVISSWIGTGQNKSISADQITNVLGSGQLQQLGQKTGIPPALVATALTTLLPMLVDKLTPNGSVQHSALADGITALRKQLG
jgi:uncharacterized protein YidB (DUF937 family)